MSELYKSFAIKAVIVALSILGSTLHASWGETDLSALATDLVNAGFIAWSLYRVSGKKLVPQEAVHIVPISGDAARIGPPGSVADRISGKVAALLFAIVLSQIVLAPRVYAQAPVKGVCNLQTLLSGISASNFAARLSSCGTADIQGALDDANTAPIDNGALACLKPLQGVVVALQAQAAGNTGLLTAFQKFRRAKQSGVVGACQGYVNSTILLQ